ncbi:MAG: hypothetical protein ACREQY_22795, partial [Candidatus Binatia bacterium]
MNLPPLLDRATRPLLRLLPARRSDSLVAVDVATRAVRAIHVRRERESLVLDGYRLARLGDDPSGDDLEGAFRQAVELRVGSEPVAVCVTSPDAAIRKVDLPPMSLQELRQALPWEARRHIAGLAEGSIVDAQVLSPGAESSPMEILLVAFPRPQYERLEGLCDRLGVPAAFVDVGQLSTMNAFLGPRPASEVLGVLDLGADEAFFAAFSPSNLLLFRDLSVRVSRLDALLGERFALRSAQLDAFKSTGKLPGGSPPAPGKLE